jgi:hypothetical protein
MTYEDSAVRIPLTDPASVPPTPAAGLTVSDLARRYRVSPDKVRGWIARGEIRATNTASVLCGRPRWVVIPDALVAFERRRASDPPPMPKRKRRKTAIVDYYPD